MLFLTVIRNRKIMGAIAHRVGGEGCWSSRSFTQFGRNLCSLSSSGKEEGEEGEEGMQGKSLSWRIEKLSRGESVSSAFQSWMGDGFPIFRQEIFHAINRLRKFKANKRALEVREFIVYFCSIFFFFS